MDDQRLASFSDWIREHYAVGNGVTLAELQQDALVIAKYRHETRLPRKILADNQGEIL